MVAPQAAMACLYGGLLAFHHVTPLKTLFIKHHSSAAIVTTIETAIAFIEKCTTIMPLQQMIDKYDTQAENPI